jgi:DNA polymerase III subunit delta
VTPEDLAEIASSGAEAVLDNVIEPALSGNLREADRNYQRALESGLNPVAIVRALQRKIDQIEAFQAAGNDPAALARSGAPRFGPPAQRFQAMARQWNPSRLARARQIAFDTERALKRSGSPAEALTGETLLRLARAAGSTR